MRFILFAAMLFLISGCATANVPGNTNAGYFLKRDIVKAISADSLLYFPACDTKILDTRVVNSNNKMVFEEWTASACNEKTTYLVEIIPDENGKMEFDVRRIK